MNTRDIMDSKVLGNKLKEARISSAVTQEQAAKRIGVGRTTLIAIEKGERKVKSGELTLLCKLYKISAHKLLREKAPIVNFSVQFRKEAKQAFANESSRYAIRLLNDLSNAAVELESLLGKPQKRVWLPEQPLQPGDISAQAEDSATFLRNRLGLGLAPVTDIVSLFETELDFRIFIRPIDSKISGVFSFDPSIGPCVLLNSNHPQQRRAFSIAHEGGHYVSTRNMPDIFFRRKREVRREDKFANLFASSFLMPATAVRQHFYEIQKINASFSPRQLILLSHKYNVTPEAMCRRLEDLKLLKKGTYDSLRERGFNNKAVSKVLGDKISETPFPLPTHLAYLCSEAHSRGLLTEGQLCDMFQIEQVDFRDLIDAFNTK